MAAVMPEHIARKVAVEAGVDPRAVKRLARGQKVRPLTASRIVATMRALGLERYMVTPPPVTEG